MNNYAQSADQYLAQRVLGASPEQQAALLMEAGQLFLGKAIRAMEQKEPFEVARYLGQVAKIINESIIRLNREDGGELVQNLLKVYGSFSYFADIESTGGGFVVTGGGLVKVRDVTGAKTMRKPIP